MVVAWLAAVAAWAGCDADVAALPALTQGEALRFRVDDVRIAGIPGLVKPSGTLTLVAAPGGGGTVATLAGTAGADALVMAPYEIRLRLVSIVDPVGVHSLGFEQHQTTSKGGVEDFDHVFVFDLPSGRWTRDEEIRKLPERPQDIVSSIYLARALRPADAPCVADMYFDRRQNPVTMTWKPGKILDYEGTSHETTAVRWDIGNASGSIKGGTVYVTDDERRLPLRFELHFSFATIGMTLIGD